MKTSSKRPRVGSGGHAQGFTLVELIVAVAIIATLLAIAIPNYRNYAERARVTAMLSELTGGKVGAEFAIMEGSQWGTIQDPKEVGFSGPSQLCPVLRVDIVPSSRTAYLFCSNGAHNYVELNYKVGSGWECKVSTWKATPRNNWAPEGCVNIFG